MNYQKIILIGNAVYDPKRKTSKDGKVKYTWLRVAVSAEHKGGRVFFPITIFGKQGELVAQHVNKGREVLVEGHVETSISGHMTINADRVVFGDFPRKAEIEGTDRVASYKEIVEEQETQIH